MKKRNELMKDLFTHQEYNNLNRNGFVEKKYKNYYTRDVECTNCGKNYMHVFVKKGIKASVKSKKCPYCQCKTLKLYFQ